MPIASGSVGFSSPLPLRGKRYLKGVPFQAPALAKINTTLAGVSRDSTGAPLGLCTVKVFRTADDTKAAQTVSDASGNWSMTLNLSGPFYLVEYKSGAPDVAGTSVNTLVPV